MTFAITITLINFAILVVALYALCLIYKRDERLQETIDMLLDVAEQDVKAQLEAYHILRKVMKKLKSYNKPFTRQIRELFTKGK